MIDRLDPVSITLREPPDWSELIFGEDEQRNGFVGGWADPARLELIEFRVPLVDSGVSRGSVDAIRGQMVQLDVSSPIDWHPLPDAARSLSWATRDQLARYITIGTENDNRIYVLDFQGLGAWQYVMFGRTRNPLARITERVRAAEAHG